MKTQMQPSRDITQIRRFDRDEFAKALHISTRTLDRRRLVGIVPKPDEVDETGHPLWFDTTVAETLLRRRQA